MDLVDLFKQQFNMEMIASDLMELIDYDVLENYILQEFKENFTYGEMFDLFKDNFGKEITKSILIKMGHDFIDLDELSEEERDKYY